MQTNIMNYGKVKYRFRKSFAAISVNHIVRKVLMEKKTFPSNDDVIGLLITESFFVGFLQTEIFVFTSNSQLHFLGSLIDYSFQVFFFFFVEDLFKLLAHSSQIQLSFIMQVR